MAATYHAETSKLASRKKLASPGVAKQLLKAPGTCALALLVAVRDLAGADWISWEPETVWLTLEALGVELPLENRGKIQAALALSCLTSFYWDGVVFEKTALAFEGRGTNPDTLEEATSAQLAWAVVEAAKVLSYFGDQPLEFQHEPAAYASVVMHREGLVVAPEQLQFAQTQLDGLNHNETNIEEIKKEWAALDKKTLATHPFSEDPNGVQLAHLAAIALHVQDCEDRAAADLAALRT